MSTVDLTGYYSIMDVHILAESFTKSKREVFAQPLDMTGICKTWLPKAYEKHESITLLKGLFSYINVADYHLCFYEASAI